MVSPSAGGDAPSQQLARLQVGNSARDKESGGAAGSTQSPAGDRLSGSTPPKPSIQMTSAPQAAEPAAAAAVSAGGSSPEADAKEAFQQRLKQHFARLMADGGMTPAAAAAEALKLAVQQ